MEASVVVTVTCPGQSWTMVQDWPATQTEGDQCPPAPRQAPWHTSVLTSADRRLDRWLQQSLARPELVAPDRPALPHHPGKAPDQFLAAGAPWWVTLFGRDALWAARMLLPLGTAPAAGTLRTLARRQGTRTDPITEEQPGKILLEVRRTTQQFSDSLVLPPV